MREAKIIPDGNEVRQPSRSSLQQRANRKQPYAVQQGNTECGHVSVNEGTIERSWQCATCYTAVLLVLIMASEHELVRRHERCGLATTQTAMVDVPLANT